MKFSLIIACCFSYLSLVLTTQAYSGQSIAQILDNPGPLTDADLVRFEGYFNATTGISTQARDDFRSLRVQHWAYLYPIATFVSESVLRDMNGANIVIETEDWYNYLQRNGYQQSDFDEILRRGEQIPSEQLDAERRARLIKFLRATKHGATFTEVRNALWYLFA